MKQSKKQNKTKLIKQKSKQTKQHNVLEKLFHAKKKKKKKKPYS